MSTESGRVRLRASAKINLGLRILGKRADGYHEIRTIYQTISLHDRLEISLRGRGRGIAVTCDEPSIPSGRDNLVHRACELWRQARKFRGGIEVHLEKKIPAGSGLGGASSDAAATILGLERLAGERLTAAECFKLAAKLGSDVPFFLWGGRALGCGHGEAVYPLPDLPRRNVLVVYPGVSMSTADAYREAGRRLTAAGGAGTMHSFGVWSQLPLEGWGPAENDFEEIAFAKWPRLARLKRRLIRAGAETASLTGSGSAVYAVFNSAQKLSEAVKHVPEEWSSFRTRTVSRAEYVRNRVIE